MKLRLFVLLSLTVVMALLIPERVQPTVAESELAPLASSDEFGSPQLASYWSWAHEDPSHWSLTARPGYLRIITQHGDIMTNQNDAHNLLLQPAPTGDFEITTKVDINPTADFQQAGPLVYQDDDNYIGL